MSFLDYFRRTPKSASTAKDRLSIIVAREHNGGRKTPDYLPQLQQELLAVLQRYEVIDLANVSVNVERTNDGEILELNIVLPDDETASSKGRPQPSIVSSATT